MTAEASKSPRLLPLVWAALFAALIAAGSYLSIPFWPVPFVLANFFIALAGLLLGPLWGGASVLLYLLLGALGLPVFAGGAGGISHFAGPTGGFLVGYFICVVVIGFIRDPQGKSIVRNSLAVLAGFVVLYLLGIGYLAMFKKTTFLTITFAMTNFMIIDFFKAVLAVAVAKILFVAVPRLGEKR